MNVLEEFWYGNLDPAEYDANTSKEYKEIVRLPSFFRRASSNCTRSHSSGAMIAG